MFLELGLLLRKSLSIKVRSLKTTLIQILAPIFFLFVFFISGLIEGPSKPVEEAASPAPMGLIPLPYIWQQGKYPPIGPYFVGHDSFPVDMDNFYLLYGPKSNSMVTELMNSFSSWDAKNMKAVESDDEIRSFYKSNPRKFLAAIFFTKADTTCYSIYINGSFTPSLDSGSLFAYKGYLNGATYYEYSYYLQSMFATIQHYTDLLLIQVSSARQGTPVAPTPVSTKAFPQQEIKAVQRSEFLNFFLGFVMNICVGFFLGTVLSDVVTEKEVGIEEAFRVAGVSPSVYWMHWFITHLIISVIVGWGLTGILYLNNICVFSNPGLVFLFMLLYLLGSVAFMYMFSTFLSKANNAVAIGFMTTFILAMLDIILLVTKPPAIVPEILTLLPFIGSIEGYMKLVNLEGTGVGLLSSTLQDGDYPFYLVYIIQACAIAFWLLITWYIATVFPSGGSSGRRWYFLFTRDYWCPSAVRSDERLQCDANELTEPISPGSAVPLQVRGLKKFFGSGKSQKAALDGVDADFAEGQLFVLLGPNGAGKTTLIRCLSGLYSLSDGDASVYGMSLRNNITEIRKMIGLCSEQNVLFDEMTAEEHLRLFARLKGVSSGQLDAVVNKCLELTKLDTHRTKYSGQYSGGMKRRLCLAIALIGDPKVVFLDEPTSGVDPQSRRSVWALIQEMKKDRVIIMTTHFMDEADLLGDRVGMLNNGKLTCCGSPLFLKNRYEVGYTMTLHLSPEAQLDPIKSLFEAIFEKVKHFELSNSEVTCSLPLSASVHFPAFLRRLQSDMETLRVTNYSINVASLEEVFLKVVRAVGSPVESKPETVPAMEQSTSVIMIADQSGDASLFQKAGTGGPSAPEQLPMIPFEQSSSVSIMVSKFDCNYTPDNSFGRKFRYFLRAKIVQEYRDRPNFFFNYVLSILFALIAFVLIVVADPKTSRDYQVMDVSNIAAYHAGIVPVVRFEKSNPMESLYVQKFSEGFSDVKEYASVPEMDSHLLSVTKEDPRKGDPYYSGLVFGGSPGSGLNVSLAYNTSLSSSIPFVLNRHANTVLKIHGISGSIHTNLVSMPSKGGFDISQLFVAIFLGMASTARCQGVASAESYSINHKIRNQLQIAGLSLNQYRLLSFLYDVLVFYPTVPFFVAFIYIFGAHGFQGKRLLAFVIIEILHPMPNVLLQYFFNCIVHSYELMYSVVPVLNYAIGIMPHVVVVVLAQNGKTAQDISRYLKGIATIIPGFNVYSALYSLVTLEDRVEQITFSTIFEIDRGVGLNIIMLVVMMVVLGIIVLYTLLSPSGINRSNSIFDAVDSKLKCSCSNPKRVDSEKDQSTVAINGMEIKGLKKDYFNPTGEIMTVVNDLSLSIRPNVKPALRLRGERGFFCSTSRAQEIFGLLGPNGAGKTTTMKMLTCDIPPTAGSAVIAGIDIHSNKENLYREIGYCPQFDALYQFLTIRETLSLFSVLRGVPTGMIPLVVQYYLDSMDLTSEAHILCHNLSSGSCRKLSLLISLLGEARVLILDEPSTGMDANMWSVLFREREQRSILLSTHSMEEAAALSSTIGIMTLGRLRCTGTTHELITRYGSGYNLQITYDPFKHDEVLKELEVRYPGLVVLEAVGNQMRLSIPKSKELPDMFEEFESLKEKLGLIFYCLSQPTLEQIFLTFAENPELI